MKPHPFDDYRSKGEPWEILETRRGALATETYVFECDEAIGSIEVTCAMVREIAAKVDARPGLSFVSTDGELRA